jgi:cell division protein FtsW
MFAESISSLRARARTFDRPLIVIAAILLVAGVVFSMSASPAATARIRVEAAFYFALRQGAYAALGAVVIVLAAQLEPRVVRRVGAVIAAIALPLCALAAFIAPEIKGASRWLALGPVSFQPSEVLKPGLVIVWAWMLSETMRRTSFPGRLIALGAYLAAAAALLAQPDIGQTVLLTLVLAPLLLLSGASWRWFAGGVAAAAFAAASIYQIYPHARARVDAFLDPSDAPGLQIGAALDAFASGGVFGRGPGEGVVKSTLPDAQADFVYAVAAEEFGLIASLGVIAVFAALAFRGLSRAARLNDPFEQLASAGLVTLMVAQAAIHIAVNLDVVPAKGMTLPFISFGGSSMLGSALTFGFLLALTRRRPGAFVYQPPRMA